MVDWRSSLGELYGFLVRSELNTQLLSLIDHEIIKLDKGVKLEDLFNKIIEKMIPLFETEYIQIVMTYQKKLRIEASSIPNQRGIEVDSENSACGYVIREKSGKPSGSGNIDEDPIFTNKFVRINQPAEGKINSFIATSIVLMDTVIGVIIIESEKKHCFDHFHEEMLQGIADQFAIAVQQSNIIQSEDFLTQLREELFEMDIDKNRMLFRLIGEEVKHSFGIKFLQILIFQPKLRNLKVVYNNGIDELNNIVKVSESICGYAVELLKSFYSEEKDVNEDPRYIPMAKRKIRSELVIPIALGAISKEHDVLGVVNCEDEEINAYDPYLRFRLEKFAKQIAPYFLTIKLNQELTRARELNHARDMLLSIVDISSNLIHRLNNIIGSIKVNTSYAEEYLKEMVDSTQLKRISPFFKEIISSSEEALDIPNEMRSRLTDTTPKDVVTTFNEIYTKLKNDKRNENIIFKDVLIGSSQIPKVNCPSLSYVFENVLVNAVSATHKSNKELKEISPAIRLQEYDKLPEKFVIISIKDNGIGIPEKDQHKIFSMRYTKENGGKKGSGLGFGLPWTQVFLESIGGEIILNSEINIGTEVLIKLPVNV